MADGSGEDRARRSLGRSLRGTWQALSDFGDRVEARHFNGDFLGTVGSAPRKVGEGVSRFGEELGTAAVRLVEEAAGGALGDDGLVEAATGAGLFVEGGSSKWEGATSNASSSRAIADGAGGRGLGLSAAPSATPAAAPALPAPVPAAPANSREATTPSSSPRTSTSLWQEVQHLQDELAKERDMRRGRVSALGTMDEGLRKLRAELVGERQLLARAEDARLVAGRSCDSSERTLEELQEEHHTLLSQRAAAEAELRRHAVQAAAAERAEREASREGAWARDGPETEALKEAKIALALVLGEVDEVRLQARQEAAQLQREIDAATAEGAELRRVGDFYAAPKSFGASVRRLLKVARGLEDGTGEPSAEA